MSRQYRYKLPPWAFTCLCVIERAVVPILIFQVFRTLFLPTTFDILLLGFITGLFFAFYLRWI
ncbi:hypothetical protein QR721_08555 [Aciduricibacillus chroicocephali]|uniref:Membrane protein YszA n=1 Tax=Aciduricibacillus chroicocephali TaxID=3054939 RepID=A0ABY9KZ81_9BACI|nr:hypothetical protein QR721_08555 [Bacillaceae bacterium 44XB]